MSGAYDARIVERDGTLVRPLVGVNFGAIVDELNAHGEFTITYPKFDPPDALGQAADLHTLGREVQIIRDGECIAWGVPTRKTASSSRGDIQVTCPGAGSLLGRRRIDAPIAEMLQNPGFEDGLDDWTSEPGGHVGTFASLVSSPVRLGANAVTLTNVEAGNDGYLHQTKAVISGGTIGLYLTVAAWFNITTWIYPGEAPEARGLYIAGFDTGVLAARSFAAINEASPRGSWQRLETGIWVPPGETWDIQVRLYAVNGAITWDAVRLVAMESLAVGTSGTDIATLAGEIVTFAQDPTKGKSDLHIGLDTPPAGVVMPFPKAWQYTDHAPVDKVLGTELAPLGFDWSLEVTLTDKTFTTWAPRKGAARAEDVTLELGVNVASYTLDEDGSATATSVTTLGDGDGPDREEGHAADTADLDGLVLQDVEAAPPGASIDMLTPLAEDRLARAKQLVRIVSVTTHQGAGDLVGLLKTGDIVTVVIDDGDVQVDDTFRIVRRELNPVTETMKLTLNDDVGARGGIQAPTVVGAVAGLADRVQNLERRSDPDSAAPAVGHGPSPPTAPICGAIRVADLQVIPDSDETPVEFPGSPIKAQGVTWNGTDHCWVIDTDKTYRASARVKWTFFDNGRYTLHIIKNIGTGTEEILDDDHPPYVNGIGAFDSDEASNLCLTPPVDLVAGDTLTLTVQQGTGSTANVLEDQSWFAIEAL